MTRRGPVAFPAAAPAAHRKAHVEETDQEPGVPGEGTAGDEGSDAERRRLRRDPRGVGADRPARNDYLVIPR